MIYQTKFKDPLNLKNIKKLFITVISRSELKFSINGFIMGHPEDSH